MVQVACHARRRGTRLALAGAVQRNTSKRETERGRSARRPGEIPRAGWRDVLWRVKNEVADDNLSMIAAGAAFFGLLALFPAVAAVVSLYGLFTDPVVVSQHTATLAGFLPAEARTIIDEQLQRVTSASNDALGIGAVIAVLLALWSAAKGVKSLMQALNVAYDERETRGFFRLNLTAVLLTLAILAVVGIALAGIAVLPALLERLPLPDFAAAALRWLRWPLLAGVAVAAIAVIYRYGPARRPAQWRWVVGGAAVSTVLWLIGSALFSWYVGSFGSYNETYGSVAAVAVLMMWFWISALVVLLGGEINAEMERQTREDTTRGEPRPLGQRQAYAADTVGPSRH
jgi:membrane protein